MRFQIKALFTQSGAFISSLCVDRLANLYRNRHSNLLYAVKNMWSGLERFHYINVRMCEAALVDLHFKGLQLTYSSTEGVVYGRQNTHEGQQVQEQTAGQCRHHCQVLEGWMNCGLSGSTSGTATVLETFVL